MKASYPRPFWNEAWISHTGWDYRPVQLDPCTIGLQFVYDDEIASFLATDVTDDLVLGNGEINGVSLVRWAVNDDSAPTMLVLYFDNALTPDKVTFLSIGGITIHLTAPGGQTQTLAPGEPIILGYPGELYRADLLKSLLPSVYDPNQPSLRGVLTALARVDEQIGGAARGTLVNQLRHDTTLQGAQGTAFERVIASFGLRQPITVNDREAWRALAILLAQTTKATLSVFKTIIDFMLGVGWTIYEPRPGEVVIAALQGDLNSSDQTDASYLKADATVAAATNSTGDYMMADHTVDGPTGKQLIVFSKDYLISDMLTLLNDVKAAGVQITVETEA